MPPSSNTLRSSLLDQQIQHQLRPLEPLPVKGLAAAMLELCL